MHSPTMVVLACCSTFDKTHLLKGFIVLKQKHKREVCSVTQELQQSRQPQLLNPLAWSPPLQGLGAASLMLVAALLWSSLRRTSLTSQPPHAAV